MQRWVTTVALSTADAAVLSAARPDFGPLLAHARAPQRWLAQDGLDAALAQAAAALLWVVAAWLAVGLLTTLAAGLPGAVGPACAGVARRMLPRVVRGVLVASAGTGVLLAPMAAHAASAGLPAPQWPTSSASPHPTSRQSASSTTDTVRVRAGDSLWAITARRLGEDATDAAIEQAWPRWYATNRAAIGADPNHIEIGQVLRAPDPTAKGTS